MTKKRSSRAVSRAAHYYLQHYAHSMKADFMFGTPVTQVELKKAQRRLREYIADLEHEVKQLRKEVYGG